MMQWDKQTEAALNGWFSAPQKAWENWWDVVASSTQNGHATPPTPPVLDYWNGITNQWLAYMQKQMDAFSPMLSEHTQTTMEQFTMGQTHAAHLLQMATDTWQAIMSNAASPEEWQASLDQYMAQLRQQFGSSADLESYVKNNSELWQLYSAEIQKFALPWLNMWQQWPQQVGMMAQPRNGKNGVENPLLTMANMYWDTYHQTMGRMVNMPSLGLMRELNEKINRGFAIWQENQQINFEYQVLLGEAFLNAYEAFMQRLLEMAKAGERVESQNKLLELWVEIADEQYLELFHSERYANTQSQYVNSSMALRRHQRELTEVLLRMNDLPTRSDLDEAHHNIFLLRKEVKALKKIVHELEKQAQATPITATPAAPKDKPAAEIVAKEESAPKATTTAKRTRKPTASSKTTSRTDTTAANQSAEKGA